MFIALRDNLGNTITSQANGLAQRALDIGICVAGVQIDPRLIRALASGTDSVSCVQSTSPWVVSGTVIANEDKNYGVVGVNTLRTAAQIGNATGAANFGAGATGAQTLRTESNQGAPNTAANAWPTKIVGAAGTNTAEVTANKDLLVDDMMNTSVVATTLPLSTVGVAGRVGGSNLVNRKSFTMQGRSANIVYGFDNVTFPFTLANNQYIIRPFGANITVYFKVTTGTGSVAISEEA
jgi:hypothetical protein